eukprot:gene16103-17724_t
MSDKHQKGIFGIKKKKSLQFRPFGKYSEPYSSSSDSSDSDYTPDNDEAPRSLPAKNKNNCEEKRTTRRGDVKEIKDIKHEFVLSIQCTDCEWDILPTEVLVRIFSHSLLTENIACLARFSRVCQQWYYASNHPSLWQKIDLSFLSDSKKANDKTLKILTSKRGPDILDLNLNDWSKLTDKGLNMISERCHNLQAISLSRCIKVPARRSITPQSHPKFSFRAVWELICSMGPDRASAPNLRILDISCDTHAMFSCKIERLQASFPLLEELYAGASLSFSNASKEEQEKSNGFPWLTALSLSSCHFLYNTHLQRLLKNATNLRLLDIRKCPYITTDCLTSLPANSLERLFVSDGDGMCSLASILNKWQHSLVEFAAVWVSNPHFFDGLKCLVEKGLSMKRLRVLDIPGSCVTMSDLRFLLTLCPKLKGLDLTSCKGLDRGIKHHHGEVFINALRTKYG